MCPLTRDEFERRSEIELDLRASKARTWLLGFLTENKDSAYTIAELTQECPKENMKAKIQNPESSINSAMTKLISNGLVKRKGSYYIRSTGRRKYVKHDEKKPEKVKEKDSK